MKLVTFDDGKGPQPGVLTGGSEVIFDVRAAALATRGTVPEELESVLTIVRAGDKALDLLRALMGDIDVNEPAGYFIPKDSVRLLAPLPRPTQVRDFLCFEKHLVQGFEHARLLRANLSGDPEAELAEMERQGILRVPDAWYDVPLYYRINPANTCGDDVNVQWPSYSRVMDFEFEFACVIGRGGKDISPENARAHIFGYMIMNDLSARDEQVRVMPGQLGPGKGKDFDNSKPMGPCLVTADEIGDPYNLTMTARLNGEIFVKASSAEMNWRFEDCIAYISQSETLEPGEIFASGTVGGGCAIEVGKTISVNDVIELEMEKIGVLRTRFVAQGSWEEQPRRLSIKPRNIARA